MIMEIVSYFRCALSHFGGSGREWEKNLLSSFTISNQITDSFKFSFQHFPSNKGTFVTPLSPSTSYILFILFAFSFVNKYPFSFFLKHQVVRISLYLAKLDTLFYSYIQCQSLAQQTFGVEPSLSENIFNKSFQIIRFK